jgi:hypothetical protein
MIEYSQIFVINRNKIMIICLETRKNRERVDCTTSPLMDFFTVSKIQKTSNLPRTVKSCVISILMKSM